MKTKEQILEHCKNVGHTETARRQICAYLIGKGVKDKEEEILLKKGECTFDNFLEWFNPKTKTNNIKFESEIIDNHDKLYKLFFGVDIHKPKFNLNDWVRVKDRVNGCGQITGYGWEKFKGFYYNIAPSYYSIREKDLVSYYPKEGEFFYVKYNYSCGKSDCIGQRDSIRGEGNYVLHFYYGIGTQDNLLYTNTYTCRNYSILELRPATKEEIQTLKDKVKKECNKEWNGKTWVDIKKSDKELFYEWKCENGFIAVHYKGQNTVQSLCIYNKIRAYTELYLFSQWVNQFCQLPTS